MARNSKTYKRKRVKKYSNLSIKPCPYCGRYPWWDKWELDLHRSPYVNKPVILWALTCAGPDHICHGSYRSKKKNAVEDWNISMTRRECKIKK
jgi:hypothetical protein